MSAYERFQFIGECYAVGALACGFIILFWFDEKLRGEEPFIEWLALIVMSIGWPVPLYIALRAFYRGFLNR